jgi:hypothetical protein
LPERVEGLLRQKLINILPLDKLGEYKKESSGNKQEILQSLKNGTVGKRYATQSIGEILDVSDRYQ